MTASKRRKLDTLTSVNKLLQPVLPEELTECTPLIEVFVDTIRDPKTTSRVVVELNTAFPVPELTHLKRIRGREVLLFPAVGNLHEGSAHELLKSKNFDVLLLANTVRKVRVASKPPKVRSQYEVVHKLWPCNFHADRYLEKLSTNTIFDDIQMAHHVYWMEMAVYVGKLSKKLSKYAKNSKGVVVVDPVTNALVAVGHDQSLDNPCKHAFMVAVDNVAKTQKGGAWTTESFEKESASDKSHIDETNDRREKNHTRGILTPETKTTNDYFAGISVEYRQALEGCFLPGFRFGTERFLNDETSLEGPYLATGYYVYATHEPCVMCAMALVHSRVNKVFYGKSSENGGLGTLCKLHTVKDLNHHYEVFKGLLQDDCENL